MIRYIAPVMLMSWGVQAHADVPIGSQITGAASGDSTNLQLSAGIQVSGADFGKTGNLYVAAALPSGQLFVLGPNGWVPYDGKTIPAAKSGITLGFNSLVILNGATNVSSLNGTVVFVGYGVDQNDMLSHGLFTPIYTITNVKPLSTDQRAFEDFDLHGGDYGVSWNTPFGGGNLVSGKHYFISATYGEMAASPTKAGAQLQASAVATLDDALASVNYSTTYFLKNGQIATRSGLGKRSIDYVGNSVKADYLADDGSTVVQTLLYSGYAEVPLAGAMRNAPPEFLAEYPINNLISANNFGASAQWLPGSAYLKVHSAISGDTYLATSCANTGASVQAQYGPTAPCLIGGTLDTLFPISQMNGSKPYETDFAADGQIKTVQGLRMWIANAPLPAEQSPTQRYRFYYEYNGNVYTGQLQKDGTPIRSIVSGGEAEDFDLRMNAAAVQSFRQGIITGATVPGSQAGDGTATAGLDLFGIGGHGVNGSLSPADLRTHYAIPADLSGAAQTVAIVDAPGGGDVLDDLNAFSRFYGLPTCSSADCYQHIDLSNGAAVPTNNDWGAEVALDTQMVHAVAPGAKIVLVTAKSSSSSDMMAAVSQAAAVPGVTAVSMSFSGAVTSSSNTSSLLTQDAAFQNSETTNGTLFFASSGDSGHLMNDAYPASSPYVTTVGGTRINAASAVVSPQSEVVWQFAGSGTSLYAPMPVWQAGMTSGLPGFGTMRTFPDVAMVADFQHSAVSIYYKQRWVMEGGTSAGAPIWAGIGALLGQRYALSSLSLQDKVKSTPGGFNGMLYAAKQSFGSAAGFHDIVSGSNNLTSKACSLCIAGQGFDGVTGLGAPEVSSLFNDF